MPAATGVTEQLQLKLERALGSVSATVAPVTACGPLFVTSTVYVSVPPGSTGSGLSVFVIDRSAVRTGVCAVALSFVEVGSVVPAGGATLAVLLIVPVALAATVALTVGRRPTRRC